MLVVWACRFVPGYALVASRTSGERSATIIVGLAMRGAACVAVVSLVSGDWNLVVNTHPARRRCRSCRSSRPIHYELACYIEQFSSGIAYIHIDGSKALQTDFAVSGSVQRVTQCD